MKYNIAGLHEENTSFLNKTRLEENLLDTDLSTTEELYKHLSRNLHGETNKSVVEEPRKTGNSTLCFWNKEIDEFCLILRKKI